MGLFSNFDYVTVITLITITAVVGSALVSVFIKPDGFQRSRAYVFVSIMASVAVIILAANVILGTISLELTRSVNKAQITKQAIDKLWLYPNQLLTEKTNVRPEYLGSLYANNLSLHNIVKDVITPPTVQSEMEEQYLAILLIQCWEDYLTFRKLDETGDIVWLVNFLQWAQSQHLKEDFNFLKYNFADSTVSFGELLFEYAKNIPIPSHDPAAYKHVAEQLLKDPRLQKIYKDRAS